MVDLPLALFHKSKTLLWDPRDIDLAQDRRDWVALSAREQQLILDLSQAFLGGETAVTHDLAPLLVATRRAPGHLHDEMFLTAQLFEESKHVEWFARVWDEVFETAPAAIESIPGAYSALFVTALPQHLNALLSDASDAAIVRAIGTYHIIIEGVLAETGYHGYKRALAARGLMPGIVRGVELVQRDEARHIAYGLDRLQRLMLAQPALREDLEVVLNDLLPVALDIISEIFIPYGDDIPFGMKPEEFVAYAADQFAARMRVLD